jgi:transposase
MDVSENARYIGSAMRGVDTKQSSMMCLLSPESVVPERHPLRVLLPRVDEILRRLSPVFDEMYSVIGRPSIPPERLLKGTLLMALYTIRSERQLCEQLGYNLLFRWFLGMDMVEPTFNHSTFSQNRERLLAHDVAGRFFREVVELARGAGLMSDDHFTVDGTLIDAWASIKSFQPKKADQGEEQPTKPGPGVDPNNEGVNFRGEHRSNETHASTTDPEARLMRKGRGKEAKLSYSAHALMENRNGLLVDLLVMPATGTAEREAALEMIDRSLPGQRRITLGADKGYDTAAFVAGCRERNVTPHVARNDGRKGGSAIDGRTSNGEGYQVSQRIRKRVEEIFGWAKTVGGYRKTRVKGVDRNQLAAFMVGAAYNLMRITKLLVPGAAAA